MSNIEDNKALVRRLFDEVWNARSLVAVDELYADDYVADYRPYAPLRRGREGIKQMLQRAWATFPDYREELLDMVAEGDKVAVRLRIIGTQMGDWGMIPATGKRVEFEEMIFLRIANGRVVEQRGIPDNLHALRQLGILPSPPPE